MSREEDREGPDPRRSSSGSSAVVVILLVGGLFAILALLAVVGMGFLFMARTAQVEEAEMRMVMEEHRAMEAENEKMIAEKRSIAASRIYTREDFKTAVQGKTEQEVEEALGKPARITQDGLITYWEY